MNLFRSEPSFVGTPVRVTLQMALEMGRYDYIVKLIRKYTTKRIKNG